MMKIISIFIFTWLNILAINAQKINQCGFKIPPALPFQNFQSVYEAKTILDKMLTIIEWEKNFKIDEQNGSNNAFATMIRGERWIIYDNDFLERLDYVSNTKWASISVIAHEVGHHYRNHVMDGKGSTVPKEIEADYFSGYIMNRLGGTLEQAKAAMTAVGTDQQTSTHPAKRDRLISIEKGWNYGRNLSKPKVSDPPPPPPPPPIEPKDSKGNSTGSSQNTNDGTWLSMVQNFNSIITIELSDDGKTFSSVDLQPNEPFVFKWDATQFGYIRIPSGRKYKYYKLYQGKKYQLAWNRLYGYFQPIIAN